MVYIKGQEARDRLLDRIQCIRDGLAIKANRIEEYQESVNPCCSSSSSSDGGIPCECYSEFDIRIFSWGGGSVVKTFSAIPKNKNLLFDTGETAPYLGRCYYRSSSYLEGYDHTAYFFLDGLGYYQWVLCLVKDNIHTIVGSYTDSPFMDFCQPHKCPVATYINGLFVDEPWRIDYARFECRYECLDFKTYINLQINSFGDITSEWLHGPYPEGDNTGPRPLPSNIAAAYMNEDYLVGYEYDILYRWVTFRWNGSSWEFDGQAPTVQTFVCNLCEEGAFSMNGFGGEIYTVNTIPCVNELP